jgi:phosphatidylglycerol---prolipoprotein diacylglyceryl transferase
VSASPECLKSRGESQRLRTGSPARCCTAQWVGFDCSYVHPQLFQFGRLILPTYGFLVAVGTMLALLVCVRSARLLSLETEKIWSVAILAVLTALAGRIVLNLLRWPPYAYSLGLPAVAVPAGAYAVHLGLPMRRTADAIAPSLALWSAVAAIACLEAGCDYGTVTNLPWAVIFRASAVKSVAPLAVPLHPVQVYASLTEFILFAFLLWLLHRPHHDGEIVGAWLFLSGLSSSLLTVVRGDLLAPDHSTQLIVAQLISAGMVLGGGLLWIRRRQVSYGG